MIRPRSVSASALLDPGRPEAPPSSDEVTENQERIEQASGWRPQRISCWVAESILSDSPGPSSLCRTVRLERLPALSFLGDLASRLRHCEVAQVGSSPGGPGNGDCCSWRLGSLASNRKSKHR